jgi:hypothetical protein
VPLVKPDTTKGDFTFKLYEDPVEASQLLKLSVGLSGAEKIQYSTPGVSFQVSVI